MFTIEKNYNSKTEDQVLVFGLFDEPNKLDDLTIDLDENVKSQLKELVASGDISAKNKVTTIIPTLGLVNTKRLFFIGLGRKKQLSREMLREGFGNVFRSLHNKRISSIAILLDSFATEQLPITTVGKIVGEALALSVYNFPGYKQKANIPDHQIDSVKIYTEADDALVQQALHIGYIYGKATNSARTLVNTPPNLLTSTDLAKYAKGLADKYHFEAEILDKEEMMELGMGALLAVNQGSEQPPKMIVLKYQGKTEWTDVIGLVGKGITYDTGGYSLKPRTSMVGMKTDMGGAASVLGAMEIIGELKPKQNVVAVIPSTDNMVSGNAFKPDDVITSLSGKTIEVTNTDAEGRLVLADGVTYAKQQGANYLVDVATLTGGVITALGSDKTGAMTNHVGFYHKVLAASQKTDEMIWQLPITERDKEKVRKSKIADLDNSPSREGHAIMGGAFIGEFAEDTPWVHLDIAGTATTNAANDLGPSGATGVMVRTLAKLVEEFEPVK